MSDVWEPINYKGHWNYDPRGELLLRANTAKENNDTYVAIPIKLAVACAKLRECGSRTTSIGDEDGLLNDPIIIQCRLPENHKTKMHYNGYINWEGTN